METIVDCGASLLEVEELVTAEVLMEVLGTGVGGKSVVLLLEISSIKVFVELLEIKVLVVCRTSLLTTVTGTTLEVSNEGVGVTIEETGVV